jgi:hypothetical protein
MDNRVLDREYKIKISNKSLVMTLKEASQIRGGGERT